MNENTILIKHGMPNQRRTVYDSPQTGLCFGGFVIFDHKEARRVRELGHRQVFSLTMSNLSPNLNVNTWK